MQCQPAARDGEIERSLVFGGAALVFEQKRPIDQLDVDASVLHSLDRICDLDELAGAVVSLQRGFHLLDFKSGDVQLIVDPEPEKANNRLNDGKVDKHGRFVAESTRLTARALLYYSMGLPAFAAVKLIVRAFYATHDTRTPVRVAILTLFVNVALNLIFLFYFFSLA